MRSSTIRNWSFATFIMLLQMTFLFAGNVAAPCPIVGPSVSCVNQLETYESSTTTGYTYAWSVTGGTPSITVGPTIMVNWYAAGVGTITLTATPNGGGSSTTCTLNVTVYARPNPVIFTDFSSDCPDKGHNEGKVVKEEKDDCWKVCEHSTVHYWTTPVAGNTYKWTIVGGTPVTGTGSNIAVTWGPAGSGTVIVTETSPGGCSETVEHCVKIIESPTAKFLYNGQDPSNPLTICKGQEVYFQDLSAGGAYWLWDFGDGTTSTDQNPSHVYGTPGAFHGTLTVRNECGCTDKIKFEIDVKDVLSPSIGCISTVCLKDCAFYSVGNLGNCSGAAINWTIQGGQVTGNPSPESVNVVWDDNDGFIAANGYGMICVKVSGCPNICDGEVCVKVPVIHSVTITGPAVVCAGEPVTYCVPIQPGINEIGGTPNGVNFGWHVSGGTIISTYPYSNCVTVIWYSTGSIKLDGYENDLSDCKFESKPLDVTVKPVFGISPAQDQLCQNEPPHTFYLTGLSVSGTFQWTVTNASGGTVVAPFIGGTSYSPPSSWAPGVYVISVEDISGVYCSVTPTAVYKIIAPPATPTGTLVGENSVCLNTPYVYTLSTVPPPGVIYHWTITGGTLSGSAGPTVTATWTGGGAMSLSVTAVSTQAPFCESGALNFSISQYVAPANFITGPASACINDTKTYGVVSALSHYTDLQWTISPATAASVVSGQGGAPVNVLFNSNASGAVTITCTATVCGGSVTSTYVVNVNQIPTYSVVAAPNPACQGSSVSLSVSPGTGIGSYSWNFGDGGTSTLAAPSHSWNSAGSFPVSVTLNLNICGNPTTGAATTVNINPVPIAHVTASNGLVLCAPSITSTTLTVSTQNVCTYVWSGSGSGTGPTLVVTSPGTYIVQAIDPVTGCSSTISTTVVNCTGPICSGTAMQFTNTESCDSYTFTSLPSTSTFVGWNFGDGMTSSTPGTVTHVYAHSGYYQVALYSYDPSTACTVVYVQTVSVKFKGDFNVNYDCSSMVMHTILSDWSEYLPAFPPSLKQWYDGTTLIGTGSVLNTTALSAGAHTITLKVTIGAQICSKTLSINVPGMPDANFAFTSPVCEGVPVSFSNTSTGGGLSGYNWAFGDGATSGLFTPQRTYAYSAGGYTVSLTISNNYGCSNTETHPISTWQRGANPTTSLSPTSGTACAGSPVVITANPGALPGSLTYAWYNSAASGVTLQGPSATTTYNAYASGIYGVKTTDGHGCVYNVLANPVTIVPPPYVQIIGNADYCLYENIHMSADIGAYNYSWVVTTPSGTETGTSPDIDVYGGTAGVYTFSVTITDPVTGCSNSGSATATVHPGINDLTISPITACAPATLTANSAVTPIYFNWSTGATSASIYAEQGGFYSVTASDQWGCTAQKDYYLDGRPDLSNVMVGCYDYCEKVVWQAPLCSGCTYQWTLNGSPISGETNPTITIGTSGVYTVIVSHGAGCDTESEPININIAQNPDQCYKCDIKVGEYKFKCIGIDPQTGLPIYDFTLYVYNNGAALDGLVVSSSFGSVTLSNPSNGYLPGGGAMTVIHGQLVWDGSSMDGCIDFLGYITKDCEVIDKCKFEWCGTLPPCDGCDCKLEFLKSDVICIGNGIYKLNVAIANYGCDLTDVYVKTPTGIYPLSPYTLPGGGVITVLSTTFFGSPGVYGGLVCGKMWNGKDCCTEVKLEIRDCEEVPFCDLKVKITNIVCTGVDPYGYPHYHFNINVQGAPAGATIDVIPNQLGLVSGVSYTYSAGNYYIQGDLTDFSFSHTLCFTVLVSIPGEPVRYCMGKACVDVPPSELCAHLGKPGKERNEGANIIDFKGSDFVLVPNPAMNEVTITRSAVTEAVTVTIADLTGKSKLVANNNDQNIRMDISTLPAGLYIVTVTDAKGVPSSRKLTIVR
ncbi:MAG: PKD domain-containing protein [Bacteroidota bacterium]